jgi:Helix-turn-helix
MNFNYDPRHLGDPQPQKPVVKRIFLLCDWIWEGRQKLMAKYLQVHPATVSRLATGRRRPSQAILARLASHPQVNRQWLYDGVGHPLVEPPEAEVDPLSLPRDPAGGVVLDSDPTPGLIT